MSILAIAGHMSDNNGRIGLEDRFIMQTPTVIGPCFRALHPNVSLRNHPQEQIFAFNGAHVQGDVKGIAAFLNPATIDSGVVTTCHLYADCPPSITHSGPFNVDDLSAHLGG